LTRASSVVVVITDYYPIWGEVFETIFVLFKVCGSSLNYEVWKVEEMPGRRDLNSQDKCGSQFSATAEHSEAFSRHELLRGTWFRTLIRAKNKILMLGFSSHCVIFHG
jgi:hypothetical protein